MLVAAGRGIFLTVSILKEVVKDEQRVAGAPDLVKFLKGCGCEVLVQSGAGEAADFGDDSYVKQGAVIESDLGKLWKSDFIIKVLCPAKEEIGRINRGQTIIANFSSSNNKEAVEEILAAGARLFAMELMPRISRAQSMDVLSSQSNLAGYRAVLEAACLYNSAMPMMMTAAGTIIPAKVFIMGVGVAGLQAIATAKRLGAVVTAYDVRMATKEQVESLGAKFVVVDEEAMKTAQTSGGYAKEMTEEYKKKEQETLIGHVEKQDIVITTALVPGKKAPILVSEEMVQRMHKGAVIIDMAAESGGNCAYTKLGEIVEVNGVKIVGHPNYANFVPKDASALFSKNIQNFLAAFWDKDAQKFDFKEDDDIIKGTMLKK